MNITLTLGDFLAIAAVVLICARGYHTYFAGPSPEQLRMQRQLDAIMKHLGLGEPSASRPGAPSPRVIALAAAGDKIEALKVYRQETGEGLKQAKVAVERAADAATSH
jgi:hypothetical protein